MLAIIISLLLTVYTNDIFLGEKFETKAYPTGRGNNDIFYWLFFSRSSSPNPPLIIWFNGGPGCSSMYGALAENGPYIISLSSPATISRNEHSWTNDFDVMYVDQPSGVGFSRISKNACDNLDCSTKDMYVFLLKFFMDHPQYAKRPLYLSGESYAGHYVPKLAEYIVLQGSDIINLKGIAVGNGWYVGSDQMMSYPSFAYDRKLISLWRYVISSIIYWCTKVLYFFNLYELAEYLNDGVGVGYIINDKFDQYDYMRKEEIPFDKYVIEFFQNPVVQQTLNTTDRPYFVNEEYSCNGTFETLFEGDVLLPMTDSVMTLIKYNQKILFYTGSYDFICNWKSQELWINNLPWEGSSTFKNSNYTAWKLNNKQYGEYKKYKNVMHLVVYEASHMVPVEQPYASYEMIKDFIISEIS